VEYPNGWLVFEINGQPKIAIIVGEGLQSALDIATESQRTQRGEGMQKVVQAREKRLCYGDFLEYINRN
jgi:hypothetical protein